MTTFGKGKAEDKPDIENSVKMYLEDAAKASNPTQKKRQEQFQNRPGQR